MKAIAAAVVVLSVAGVAMGQTHAPWPVDWNNWSDPALWVTVGNPGNTGELSGAGAGGEVAGNGAGGYGPDRVCGAVAYEYRIGKYEVTAGQYTEFLNKVAGVDNYALYNTAMWSDARGCQIERYAGNGTVSDPYKYRVATDFANRPVNYVSWGDAARFANWLHNGKLTGWQDTSTTEDGAYYLDGAMSNETLEAVNRKSDWKYAITSEDEWYKAAYYKGGGTNAGYWDYPTSNDPMTSNDLIDPDPGNNATFYDHGYTIGSPYYRTEVGEFELSDSPYGTFDQGGNVWEWNESILYEHYRNVRGGSFDGINNQQAAGRRESYKDPTYEDFELGFRVSEVPEPATLSLLGLAGLVLVGRKRK